MRYQTRKTCLCTGFPQGGLPALTLVEMVIAMAIMAIVFAAVLPEFRAIQNSWDSKAGTAETLQNGRVLMDHLYHNLSKAARITTVSDSAETNGYIEFEDNAGSTLRYDIGDNNYVEFGPVGSLSELAGPVSQLQFTCYDACDLDTPITDVDKIRSVKFKATLLNPSALGQNRTFIGQAYLRANTGSAAALLTLTIAVSDKIEVKDSGRIEAMTGTAIVSTNSTGNNKIKVKDDGVIDGDAYVGPGGSTSRGIEIKDRGEITGNTGVLTSAVTIPTPTEPSLGSNIGDRKYDDGTTTIYDDIHCDKFKIEDDAIVQISGDVTILAEDEIKIKDNAQLKLLTGATLTIYSKDNVKIEDDAQVNVNTDDSSRLMIYHLVDNRIELKDDVQAYGTVIAPYAELKLKGYAKFYGTCTGKNVKVEENAIFYCDSSSATATAPGGIVP